jgi:hypothetical protein
VVVGGRISFGGLAGRAVVPGRDGRGERPLGDAGGDSGGVAV